VKRPFRALKSGANTGDGAVVIGALNVDGATEPTLPFGYVICDVRQEIRKRTVTLSHHAILVVAEIGRREAKRASCS